MSSITLDGLELPWELQWVDEFAHTGIVAAARYSLTGVQYIESSSFAAGAGRQITLYSEDAWITRTDLITLRQMAANIDSIMTLNLRGRVFTVMFRHWDAPVVEAENVRKIADPQSTDEYILRVKLITV